MTGRHPRGGAVSYKCDPPRGRTVRRRAAAVDLGMETRQFLGWSRCFCIRATMNRGGTPMSRDINGLVDAEKGLISRRIFIEPEIYGQEQRGFLRAAGSRPHSC